MFVNSVEYKEIQNLNHHENVVIKIKVSKYRKERDEFGDSKESKFMFDLTTTYKYK